MPQEARRGEPRLIALLFIATLRQMNRTPIALRRVMMARVRKLDEDWQAQKNPRGETWRFRDLSGDHLGVRVEELAPGETSSEHHYHSSEEEHVLVLAGRATLQLGDEQIELVEGDHVWFRAGEAVAHHIINSSDELFRFLVFGERKPDDIVMYPEHQVMLVKSMNNAQYTYRSLPATETTP